MAENENVCYAISSPRAALAWTTLAFFAGFAGVSAFGPIVPKLKQAMDVDPFLMGILAALALLAVSPFTRLVHIWSVPLFYIFRRPLLFRRRVVA